MIPPPPPPQAKKKKPKSNAIASNPINRVFVIGKSSMVLPGHLSPVDMTDYHPFCSKKPGFEFGMGGRAGGVEKVKMPFEMGTGLIQVALSIASWRGKSGPSQIRLPESHFFNSPGRPAGSYDYL
jgi:hypothetical protein